MVGAVGLTVPLFWPRMKKVPAIPFSDDARLVLDRAAEEARSRGTAPISPNHILLALIATPASRAASVLAQLGVDLQLLQEQLESGLPRNAVGSEQALPLYRADSYRVLEEALQEAVWAQMLVANSEQLLAGIMRVERSTAARMLRQSGASLPKVRRASSPLAR